MNYYFFPLLPHKIVIVGVIVLTELANRFRLHKLNHVEKFVMSYGGLRGAVAFALVLLVDPKKVKMQPLFVTATISVVYFTVFFQVLDFCYLMLTFLSKKLILKS